MEHNDFARGLDDLRTHQRKAIVAETAPATWANRKPGTFAVVAK